MKETSKIVDSFKESIFTSISQLALDHGAINLSQGVPDFNGPLYPRQYVSQAVLDCQNQQTPAQGLLELRQAVGKNYQKYFNLNYSPQSDITITCGATEGLLSTFLAILNPGDEVIVFEPFFDTYIPVIEMCQAKAIVLTLDAPEFLIDIKKLEEAITPQTKAIVTNYPHNPSGALLSANIVAQLARVVVQHDLYVISDEVYQFLIYDNHQFAPLACHPDLYPRTFTISSSGKTFGFTGWRVGWVAAPPALSRLIRLVHQNTTFAAPRPLQLGACAGFTIFDDYLPEFVATYQKKRDLLFNGLKSIGYQPLLPVSTYFILCPVPTEEDDVTYIRRMITESKVAAIPCSAFYRNSAAGKKWIRFCFAKEDHTLEQGLIQLRRIMAP